MAIDPQLLDEIMADARRHHPEEEDLDLRQRAVYRYAHLHSWHWKKYLLEALFAGAASIGFLVLLVWFLIHHG